MRKGASVFVVLVAGAFTAGNLAVAVSAATPARTLRTGSASGARTTSPGQGTWKERPTHVAEVGLSTLPRAKAATQHANLPLRVRDEGRYAEIKKHPKGNPGHAIKTGSASPAAGQSTPLALQVPSTRPP